MIYFPSLVEATMMFGLVLIVGVLFPFLFKLDHKVCVINSWQVWDAWLIFFGHRFKHVVFNILYYNFAGDVGVGSLLMAPKEKGEGEGRMSY